MLWHEKYNAWDYDPEEPKQPKKPYPSLEELKHMLDDEAVDEEDDASYFWGQISWPTDDDEAKAPPKRRNRKHLPRPQKDDFYREKLNAILIYLEESTDDTSFYRHDFFLRQLACLEETRHLSSRQKVVIDKTIEELDLIC